MTEEFGPGSTFGGSDGERFVVEAEIGRGGQAEVFRCKDSRLHRLVALKVCTAPDGTNRKLYLDRFEHELRLTSRVQHPHVLQVYDCGELDNGQPWVMLEYMEHGSLADLVRRERDTGYYVPLAYVHYYATSMAAALRASHGAQIVHRDVKPDNVLVGQDGVAKLTDFGIAKDLTSEAPQLTAIGQTLGTLGFMANEQLKGLPGPQSDIFSWGISVYCLLLGRMPKQETVNSIPMGILEKDALKDVPPAFQSVLAKAMALDLKERYASFTELLTDLRQVDLSSHDTRPLFTPDSLPALPSNAFVSGFTTTGGRPAPLIHLDGTVPAQAPLTYDGTLAGMTGSAESWADTADMTIADVVDAAAETRAAPPSTPPSLEDTGEVPTIEEPGPTRSQAVSDRKNAAPPAVGPTRLTQEAQVPDTAPGSSRGLLVAGVAAVALTAVAYAMFGGGPAPIDPAAEQAAASAYGAAVLRGDAAGASSAAHALPASASGRTAGELVAAWDALASGAVAQAQTLAQPLLSAPQPAAGEAALISAASHRLSGIQGYAAALDAYRKAAACGTCVTVSGNADRGIEQSCLVLGPAVADCAESLTGVAERDRLFAAAGVLRADGHDAAADAKLMAALGAPGGVPSCLESAALAGRAEAPAGVSADDFIQARRAAARSAAACGAE